MWYKNQNKENFLLFIISFIVITIFSKCSFLYPAQDWSDANIYFTLGKGILKGYVPYRDLFDHKGPVIFFIQTVGALISYKSFLGVYILEIIAAFIFLKISKQTVDCLVEKFSYPAFFIIAIIIYSSYSFCRGDSAEEFALPCFAYGLYLSIRYTKMKILPNFWESILLGVCISFVFWMKYNMIGFYIGLFVFMLIVAFKEKFLFEFVCRCLFILLGFISFSIIPLGYFACNNAIGDLWNGYFISNICSYNKLSDIGSITSTSLLRNYLYNSIGFILHNPLAFIILVFGLLPTKKQPLQCKVLPFICFIFSAVFIYFSIAYSYYSLIFAVFMPLSMQHQMPFEINRYVKIGSALIICIVCFLSNANTLALCSQRDRFLPSIVEELGIDENANILCYKCLDIGINTITGSVPQFLYFFRPNFSHAEQIEKEQRNYILQGKANYVVADELINDLPLKLIKTIYIRPVNDYLKELVYKVTNKDFTISFDSYGKYFIYTPIKYEEIFNLEY